MEDSALESAFYIHVVSSGLERMPRTRLDDAGTRIFRPATAYAIETTAHISRRPHARDAVAGQRVRRVARMVQAPSLQAAGPHTARRLHSRLNGVSHATRL